MEQDLINKFPELNNILIYFPSFENSYQCYYNVEYGQSPCTDEAILFLLAHLIYSSGKGTAKSVTSESVGNVSVSYANNQSSDFKNFFNSSFYGQMFLFLTRKVGGYFV